MTETLSEPKSPKLSIASLALGIIALAVFWPVMFAAVAHVDGADNALLLLATVAGVILGLGAVVTGILARRRVKRGVAARGGIALAGIALGVLAAIVPAALLAYLAYAVYSGYEAFEACVRGSGTAHPDYMCLKECPPFLDSVCRKHIRW
jgi:MFS family permease